MDILEEERQEDLDHIAEAIKDDLSVEILWSAMQYLKENPTAQIRTAIVHGMMVWDVI